MKPIHLASKTLNLCADSVEFCQEIPSIVAIGCYELDQETKLRKGAIHINSVIPNEEIEENWTEKQIVEVPGIFGMEWKQRLLASANAGGSVLVFNLDDDNTISKVTENGGGETDNHCLSIAWSPSEVSYSIAASYSSGALEVFQLNEDNTLISTWKHESAHSNEAWITHFDCENEHILYSGADDCRLKAWDIRIPPHPCWVNRKHDAGITCILTSPHFPNKIIVGSYDETLNVYDLRKPTADNLSSIPLGGGIWRIKSRPQDHKLAIAAMRGFYHIVNLENDELIDLTCYDSIHPSESLSYGVDWVPNSDWLLSASFYDHLASLWKIENED